MNSVIGKVEKYIFSLPKGSVLAIDGYSGSGKTALLETLSKKHEEIMAIYMDDYILPGEQRARLIDQSDDPSSVFELRWYDYDAIKNMISEYKKKPDNKYFIIEGVFLFHPDLFKDFFDYRIFLNIDRTRADARRVKREKKRWGKKYISEEDPKSWTRLFKIAWGRYIKNYNPRDKADLVIDV